MVYRKNLYSWEQASRVVVGLTLAVAALWWLPGSAIGYVLAVAAANLALTGVFGYCPVCAVAGRRPIIQGSVAER